MGQSLQLLLLYLSVSVSKWSAGIFFTALRTSLHIYTSPAPDRNCMSEGAELQAANPRKTSVHTSDLKASLPYNMFLKSGTSSHVCIHDSHFVAARHTAQNKVVTWAASYLLCLFVCIDLKHKQVQVKPSTSKSRHMKLLTIIEIVYVCQALHKP